MAGCKFNNATDTCPGVTTAFEKVEEAAFIPAVSTATLIGMEPIVKAEQKMRPGDDTFAVTVIDFDAADKTNGDKILGYRVMVE